MRLWHLESGKEIATFTGDSKIESCAFTPDGRTIIAGDESGRVHFLEIVEVDTEDNVLAVKGAVPGPNGGYVVIRRAKR